MSTPLLQAAPGQAWIENSSITTSYFGIGTIADKDSRSIAATYTDVDVMVFAAEVGEAQAQTGGKMLLERSPAVIAAVEKMWERDELGLRTKWLDHAKRALDLLSHK